MNRDSWYGCKLSNLRIVPDCDFKGFFLLPSSSSLNSTSLLVYVSPISISFFIYASSTWAPFIFCITKNLVDHRIALFPRELLDCVLSPTANTHHTNSQVLPHCLSCRKLATGNYHRPSNHYHLVPVTIIYAHIS